MIGPCRGRGSTVAGIGLLLAATMLLAKVEAFGQDGAARPPRLSRNRMIRLRRFLDEMTDRRAPLTAERKRALVDDALDQFAPETGCTLEHPDEFNVLLRVAEEGGAVEHRRLAAQCWERAAAGDAHRAAMTWEQHVLLLSTLEETGLHEEAKRLAPLIAGTLGKAADKSPAPVIVQLHQLRELAVKTGSEALAGACDQRIRAVSAGHAFPADAAPFEIIELGSLFRAAKDTDNLMRLCAFIADDYLPQAGLPEVVWMIEWVDLLEILRDGGTAAQKSAVVAAFCRLAPTLDYHVSAFDKKQFLRLSALLKDMEAPSEIRELATRCWLRLEDAWDALSAEDRRLIEEAASCDPAKENKALLELDGRMSARDKERKLAPIERVAIWKVSLDAGQRTTAAKWARSAIEPLARGETPSVTPAEFDALARMLVPEGVSVRDADTRKRIWTVLVALDTDAAEVSDEAFISLGRMVGANGALPMLEEEQFDEETGRINLAIVRTLAWHWHNRRNIREYTAALVEVANSNELKGDNQALADLATGYAGAVIMGRSRPSSFERIAKALDEAQSQEIRLVCLKELAQAARLNGGQVRAAEIAGAYRDSFSDKWADEANRLIDVLEKEAAARSLRKTDAPDPKAVAKWRTLLQEKMIERSRRRNRDPAGPGTVRW